MKVQFKKIETGVYAIVADGKRVGTIKKSIEQVARPIPGTVLRYEKNKLEARWWVTLGARTLPFAPPALSSAKLLAADELAARQAR